MQRKKIWPTVLSWLFFLCSFFVSVKVPIVRMELRQYDILYALKNLFSDYRNLLLVGGWILAALVILIPIEIYNEKVRGIKSDPEKTKGSLKSLWLFLEFNRFIAVIVGIVILLAGFLG